MDTRRIFVPGSATMGKTLRSNPRYGTFSNGTIFDNVIQKSLNPWEVCKTLNKYQDTLYWESNEKIKLQMLYDAKCKTEEQILDKGIKLEEEVVRLKDELTFCKGVINQIIFEVNKNEYTRECEVRLSVPCSMYDFLRELMLE